MDKDDIAEALNHVDGEHKVTDIYIEKDWSIVDKVQSAVIAYIRKLSNSTSEKAVEFKIKDLNNPIEQRKNMRLVSA